MSPCPRTLPLSALAALLLAACGGVPEDADAPVAEIQAQEAALGGGGAPAVPDGRALAGRVSDRSATLNPPAQLRTPVLRSDCSLAAVRRPATCVSVIDLGLQRTPIRP